MATIDATERTRLMKLGNLVANHLEKHWVLLTNDHYRLSTTQEIIETVIMQADATRLLGLGKLLGEDGKALTEAGDKGAFFLEFYHGMNISPSEIDSLTSLYQQRQENPTATAGMEHPTHDLTDVDKYFVSFAEDFLRVCNADPKPKCVFCNDRPGKGKALMACGRCKVALYCDKLCQRLDWKKDHKTESRGWAE
ncbi:unnamed protein product [Zymoseptoria tritici ST99CH_3D7]|uniref:MYND-type domain-containing protein n=1 Tax=Zymoseptoria tritici (strain ST99CH_3D7) TaxID=1276538 RepID=A0A1X7S1X9_ZYMT9|nr:unnamed protein product [Zymoseptoria tritici ST99CH_3D7]